MFLDNQISIYIMMLRIPSFALTGINYILKYIDETFFKNIKQILPLPMYVLNIMSVTKLTSARQRSEQFYSK